MRLRKRYLFPLLVMALGALLPGQALAKTDPVSVVAGGLDVPRGVATRGDLAIIAEAGHGANTSQISSVDTQTGDHHTIAGGLVSILIPEGDFIGAEGVAVRHGQIYAIFGAAPQNSGQAQAGQLVKVHEGGVTEIAQVGGFDFAWTTSPAAPKTQEHDSNPNAVLPTDHGFLVADSGSNTITSVSRDGHKLAVVHFFGALYNNFPHDEVPTCVASANGALWVGTLAGNLWRLDEDGVTQVVPRDSSGKALLGRVTGCTAANNTLYIVSMFGSGTPFVFPPKSDFIRGNVVRFNTDEGNGKELANSFDSPALQWPYAPAVGRDGKLYVTAGTICQANGTPEPGFTGVPGCTGGGRLVKIALQGDDD